MSRAWITTLPDGRTNYKFHQSWLADTDLCLERARLGLVDELNDDAPSDATAVGTSGHWAIECAIEDLQHGEDGVYPVETYIEIAQEKLSELIATDGFTWKKRAERGARTYLTKFVTNWYEVILPALDPMFTELAFGPYVFYEDDQRVIELAGSIDYVDRRGIMDWKSGSPHSWSGKDWEKARFAIQPTVYTYGWMRYCEQHDLPAPPIPQPFWFVVMLDNGAVQKVKVERRPEDWAWLQQKVLAIVNVIESMGTDGPWPKDDTHALCSAKWCPAWSRCKGAHVAETWPK